MEVTLNSKILRLATTNMTLEDFERELSLSKKREEEQKEKLHRREKDGSGDRRHHKHRHHHSSRHHDSHYDEDDERRRKRRRRSLEAEEEGDASHRRRHHHREGEIHSSSQKALTELECSGGHELKRDSWMEAPSALDIDYVQRPQRQVLTPTSNDLAAKFEL